MGGDRLAAMCAATLPAAMSIGRASRSPLTQRLFLVCRVGLLLQHTGVCVQPPRPYRALRHVLGHKVRLELEARPYSAHCWSDVLDGLLLQHSCVCDCFLSTCPRLDVAGPAGTTKSIPSMCASWWPSRHLGTSVCWQPRCVLCAASAREDKLGHNASTVGRRQGTAACAARTLRTAEVGRILTCCC